MMTDIELHIDFGQLKNLLGILIYWVLYIYVYLYLYIYTHIYIYTYLYAMNYFLK